MKTGDKVVCINDNPTDHRCFKKLTAVPIKKGVVYVINDARLMHNMPSVTLIGVNYRCPICFNKHFKAKRFRLLEELKQEAK